MSLKYLSLILLASFSLNSFAEQTCDDAIIASTPDDRFTVNGDGTVTDVRTGLIWQRCLVGQTGADCSGGSAESLTWQAALQHAANTDWRLPNIKELASIVELKCHDPAINLEIFPNTPSSVVWSGSPVSGDSHYAWDVGFYYGNGNYDYRVNYRHVRLVRGGQ